MLSDILLDSMKLVALQYNPFPGFKESLPLDMGPTFR